MTPKAAIAFVKSHDATGIGWAEPFVTGALLAEIERLRTALRTLGYEAVAEGAELPDGLAERGA